MRIAIVAGLLAAALAVVTSRSAAAGDIPEPRLDRIDYAHPEKYVSVPATLGKRETLDKIAGQIEGKSPREKLAAIGTWIDAHLKYDASTFDRWRDVDKLLADGNYGGCADHAEFFGAVARSCGIPTVWVKSLDLDWIAWFRAHPDQPRSWNGHVFVEVHVDGKWRLYDASQRVLYDDYDVKQRILPGHRLAYDKGGDPFELLLSTRWEDWKKQTRRFVESLDLSLVPVGGGMEVASNAPPPTAEHDATPPKSDRPATVFVVGRSSEYCALAERGRKLGFQVSGGDGAYDKWMPGARGGKLVVVSVAGELLLPETYRSLMPADADAIRKVLETKASDVLRKKAEDGTEVVLLMARDKDSMKAAIDAFTFDQPK